MAFEDRLEALAHSLELLAGMHLDSEKRNQERADQFLQQQAAITARQLEAEERHDREMADLRDAEKRSQERADQFKKESQDAEKRSQERAEYLFERIAANTIRQHEAEERFDRGMAHIKSMLDRAVRLSVQEAPHERKLRQKLDAKMRELAAAQAVTKQLFQAFLKRDGNGTH